MSKPTNKLQECNVENILTNACMALRQLRAETEPKADKERLDKYIGALMLLGDAAFARGD